METKSIQEAYRAAWEEINHPTLDSENPHFHNRYASLKSVLNAIREACDKHHIAYCQVFKSDHIETLVMDGENSMALSSFPVTYTADPQKFGSALTYAKRQAAQLDWTIAAEEDDDAENAPRKAPETPKKDDRHSLYVEIGKLKSEAISAGVKEEGIRSYLETTYIDQAGNPRPFASLTIPELQQVKHYLAELIENMGELK